MTIQIDFITCNDNKSSPKSECYEESIFGHPRLEHTGRLHCLTSWRQALLGRKFQLHASLAAYAWVGSLRGDRDYIRVKTFTRPDECILNAKMIWIEMWRARACGPEVAAFDEIISAKRIFPSTSTCNCHLCY